MARFGFDDKDPAEDIDFEIDFSDLLDGSETIASYTLTVPTGITDHDDSNTDSAVIFWLSGGTAGEEYDIACEIVTSAGRTKKRSLTILVYTK
jgi:hypothetical protein